MGVAEPYMQQKRVVFSVKFSPMASLRVEKSGRAKKDVCHCPAEALGQRNKLLREIQSLKNPLWRHCSMPEEDGSLPEEFYCPITQELMRDPVVAPGTPRGSLLLMAWTNVRG